MAAIIVNTADAGRAVRFLEAYTVVNQAGTVAKVRAVKVPGWAESMSFYLYIDSQTGTTPSTSFDVNIPDFGSATLFAAPDDANIAKLADVASITAVTGAGPYLQTVDIGPGMTGIADDVTGGAAADARMAINAALPPWLAYTLTTLSPSNDADYIIRVIAHFRGR